MDSVIRVGLYYDLRNPGNERPWDRLYAETLERIAALDEAGLQSVWFSEHHAFPDGYLPAPLTLAAAVAARTKRARIGTAVVVSPFVHPRAIAEQAAVVDILSGGRLELGLGAGWREAEFASFGADFAGRYRHLEATAAALPDLWRDGSVTPPPVQDPIPRWIGARGPRGARLAGRVGAGLLWLSSRLLPAYREGLEEGGHDRETARMGGLVNVFLADDPEAAWSDIRSRGRHNRATYRGADTGTSDDALPRLEVLTASDASRRVASAVAGLPVSDVFCFADIGGLPGHLTERHGQLVATELPWLLAGELERRQATDSLPTGGGPQ